MNENRAKASREVPRELPAWLLYLVAIGAGSAIMGVQIVGARLLSPVLGSSHFVWTAQIGVTMVALAAGYFVGGRWADRYTAALLGWSLLGAGLCMLGALVICEPVAYWALEFPLAIGSLLASAILFFLPLSLLSTASPYLIKLATRQLGSLGSNMGRFNAAGTFGSFLGTLLIGYVILPWLPNSKTVLYIAACVMVLGLLILAGSKRGALVFAVPFALIFLALAWGPIHRLSFREYNLVKQVADRNSPFGRLQVLDRKQASIRYLLNDNLIQNAWDFERKQSPLAFSYILTDLPLAYAPQAKDALVIGMGVGIVPMNFARRELRVDTVEINPVIPSLAREYFDLDASAVNVFIQDGRYFLNRSTKQYDIIVFDAFAGDFFPSHLMTVESLVSARKRLKPGGLVVLHTFGSSEPEKDFFLSSLQKTLTRVFSGIRVHTTGKGAYFFFAWDGETPSTNTQPGLKDVHPAASEEVQFAFNHTVETFGSHGLVLTDDYNPADYFDAKARENLRRKLALSARRM